MLHPPALSLPYLSPHFLRFPPDGRVEISGHRFGANLSRDQNMCHDTVAYLLALGRLRIVHMGGIAQW
jgi:hypothetical protein